MPRSPFLYRRLTDCTPAELCGTRVLLRADLNVPVAGGRVVDDWRLRALIPTLTFLHKVGARTVLVGHIGRAHKDSLAPIAKALNECITVGFAPGSYERALPLAQTLSLGSILLLENLRRERGEEKNSIAFAKLLARFGERYVDDAFASAHRAHASIVGVPRYLPSYAGPLLDAEVQNLSSVLNPERPLVAIVGGFKFETKVPVLRRLMRVADKIFIVGAIAHAFYRAQGLSLGKSLLDASVSATPFMRAVGGRKPKIILPEDLLVTGPRGTRTVLPSGIERGESSVDIGPESAHAIARALMGAGTVLWNGPAGNCEAGYTKGTEAIARAIASSSARSIVGGGDTVAATRQLSVFKRFSFVSTGGGAMLEFIAKGTLPGIEALVQSRRRKKGT